MSIASEITRLQGVKSDILTAIADKGVTVPAGSALDDCPGLIASIPTFEDVIGGRKYKTVEMPDGKVWLAENLDLKFISCVIGPNIALSSPAAWYYNNDEATYGIDGTRKCGLLYNWYAVKLLNDYRTTVIPGWHVPTTDELAALYNAVGLSTAGTKLEATDVSWAPEWVGTDDYGFGILPTGSRYTSGFDYVGQIGVIWTMTEIDDSTAYMDVFDSDATIRTIASSKGNGHSIRLVKD